jgi:hypothetical protein
MINEEILTLVFFIQTGTLRKKAAMLFSERKFCSE